MGAADLLDDVWCRLAEDVEFLAFRGLDLSSDEELKMEYIEKEEQSDENVTAESLPKVLLYERPGANDRRTSLVYVAKVVISFYAPTTNTAQRMADRAWELLKSWQSNGSAFSCQLAYRTSFVTGTPGIKGYRVTFDFTTYTG